MKTGDTGLNLIKAYEGLRLSAQSEPLPGALPNDREALGWSVGYGHRSTAAAGMTVTEREATRLLGDDIQPIEELIRTTVRAPLNQNEHDALVSLIFNIGEDNFRRSTVLSKLNDGDKLGAADAFERWSRARVDGKLVKLDGLVRRRAAEKSLFLMPTDAELVVPTSEVTPAEECDGAIRSEDAIKNAPLFDFKEFRRDRNRHLTAEEQEQRLTALYHAQQALTGDPAKMIVSKAEEREDIGVTVGAIMATLMVLCSTVIGGLLLMNIHLPHILGMLGLSPSMMAQLKSDLPLWLIGSGGVALYFLAYVLVKRANRHGLKRRRAVEVARVRHAD